MHDILEKYAAFFGVEYHQMGNPDYPVPTFEQLPIATREAIAKVKKEQAAAKAADDRTKASNKEQGIPGRAKQLHALVAEGFFKKPRTGKEAFTKLKPGIPKSELGQYTVEIGKIAVTLSSGKFAKLLDKLEPTEGSTAVRFLAKVNE